MIYQYFFCKNYCKSVRFVELTFRNTTQICALQILSWTQTYLTGIFPIINNMLTDYSLRFKLQTMLNMRKISGEYLYLGPFLCLGLAPLLDIFQILVNDWLIKYQVASVSKFYLILLKANKQFFWWWWLLIKIKTIQTINLYKLGFEDRCYNSTEQINILLENLFIIFSYSLIFNHMRGWGLQYKSSNEIIQKWIFKWWKYFFLICRKFSSRFLWGLTFT